MNDSRRPSDDHDLDRLLRDWHADNAEAARAGRDRLLDDLDTERPEIAGRIDAAAAGDARPRPERPDPRRRRTGPGGASLVPGTGLVAAALFVIVSILAVLVIPAQQNRAFAQIVQVPDGGRLDAFDGRGELIGPCPLQHTDVDAEISGPIVSVSIRQRYANPYDTPIEAVYTFPMSNRAAVHRMTMTVVDPDGGERVVEGEVKERELARAIYEQARDAGFVATLLEQERPNIFTQSVANIEPGATVTVEIGYLEVIDARDGEYAFEFPTVVGPRYIPGGPRNSSGARPDGLPDGIIPMRGIVLQGPGRIVPFADPEDWNAYLQRPVDGFDGLTFDAWNTRRLDADPEAVDPSLRDDWTSTRVFQVLASGVRIPAPSFTAADTPAVVLTGGVVYDAPVEGENGIGDAVPEFFTLFEGGFGRIGDRWFHFQLPIAREAGEGFAPDTDQVPDASRITPMPVRPDVRAGHDLSISVSIDTGGVPIVEMDAPLHEVEERRDGDDRVMIALADRKTIPNRDFVLRWRLKDDAIAESVFTHVAPGDPAGPDARGADLVPGGYLTMVLAPPARVEPEEVRPRELVFVLDTSGSMRGFPIEKSKAVVMKAIDAMRPNDTFNVITFAGSTRVLWSAPKPANDANRLEAQQFIDGLGGGGGTEMMKAIEQALVQVGGALPGPIELANLPADGRMVTVGVPYGAISTADGRTWLVVRDGLRIPMSLPVALPTVKDADPTVELFGRWLTQDGERRFEVAQASFVESTVAPPMRIALFFTDGYVGNDQAIIQAVRDNARSTRVFSLGIGNSVNRYLLDEMARHGRGAVDYVLLADGADEVVETLARRIETPVLTDIEVSIEGVEAFDILPKNPAGLLPDLYDAKPILIHARYAPPTGGPVSGTVVVTGTTGAGPWERRIPVTFSSPAPAHAAIATLWGRAKVDDVLDPHLAAVQQGTPPLGVKAEVVRLGEAYDLMTPFTSFVAVEKSRVVIGGRPMLVTVPIELPEGTDWNGFFGADCPPIVRERARDLAGTPPRVEAVEVDTDDPSLDAFEADALFGETASRRLDSKVAPRPRASSNAASADRRWFAQSQQGRTLAAAPPTAAGRKMVTGRRSRGGGGGGGFGGGGGGEGFGSAAGFPSAPAGAGAATRSAESALNAESSDAVELEEEVAAIDDAVLEEMVGAVDETEGTAEASVGEDDADAGTSTGIGTGPKRDLAKLMATLDRRLLMLALGATASEVPGLPAKALDGRPLVDDGKVSVTMLVKGRERAALRVALERLGVRVEGLATAGIEDTVLVVGRIAIDRLLDLGESGMVRRVVPAAKD